MSTFWHTVNPAYSGEAWLSLNDPKKKTKAQTEREAVKRGRVSNQCMEDGNLPTISIDELIEVHGFEGFHESIHGCGESVHIDYKRSRTGFVECDEQEGEISREELKERLLARCTQGLKDMLGGCGNSWSKLIQGVTKNVAAGVGRSIQKEINETRKKGASQQEIIKLVERRLGKYFPAIVEKHAKKKDVPTIQQKMNVQLQLFETETI